MHLTFLVAGSNTVVELVVTWRQLLFACWRAFSQQLGAIHSMMILLPWSEQASDSADGNVLSQRLAIWTPGSGMLCWLCLTLTVLVRQIGLLQSLQAATGSLVENVQPLLQYWIHSRVKYFVSCKSILLTKAAPIALLNLSIMLWHLVSEKKRHSNKSAFAKSSPVQSSRSKSMTCPRKGRLLRLQSNSTPTSNGD